MEERKAKIFSKHKLDIEVLWNKNASFKDDV